MAFSLSPAVTISEIDLSTIVPAVPSSIGAIAGAFQWGPVEEIRTIASEVELANTFGKPNNDVADTWFSASNFLSYSGNLRSVRVIGASSFNANTYSGATEIVIKNEDDYDNNHAAGQEPGITWHAKYPGELGNSLKVYIMDQASWTTFGGATGPVSGIFQGKPNTSAYAAEINASANDEVHIAVVDEDGKWTGTAGTVLEKYEFLSKASDAKTESGETNYYKNVINARSRYIWFGNHTSDVDGTGAAWGSVVSGSTGFKGATGPTTAYAESLVNGKDDNVLTSANEIAGYDLYKSEDVDVNLIIAGSAENATITDLIDNIAESRKDCIVLFSPLKADVVNNAGQEETKLILYITDTINPNSSYAVMDGNWKYQYDKYNDVFRWVPLNGDIAGLCARTDYTNDPWFSPAGYNRGIIKNVIKLAWNPTKANRDNMYLKGINPVISQPGLGTVLFGDKTTLAKPSAFDRINVRRLFITLEKAIATAAKFSLFELNDAFTRAQFVGLVEPYLRDVKGRRGIYDFKVVCDETNNTPQVIDSNGFVGDIYIKPARSINFIQLNFVAVRTGVEFSEIVGQF